MLIYIGEYTTMKTHNEFGKTAFLTKEKLFGTFEDFPVQALICFILICLMICNKCTAVYFLFC